jgi:hypothetical protein
MFSSRSLACHARAAAERPRNKTPQERIIVRPGRHRGQRYCHPSPPAGAQRLAEDCPIRRHGPDSVAFGDGENFRQRAVLDSEVFRRGLYDGNLFAPETDNIRPHTAQTPAFAGGLCWWSLLVVFAGGQGHLRISLGTNTRRRQWQDPFVVRLQQSWVGGVVLLHVSARGFRVLHPGGAGLVARDWWRGTCGPPVVRRATETAMQTTPLVSATTYRASGLGPNSNGNQRLQMEGWASRSSTESGTEQRGACPFKALQRAPSAPLRLYPDLCRHLSGENCQRLTGRFLPLSATSPAAMALAHLQQNPHGTNRPAVQLEVCEFAVAFALQRLKLLLRVRPLVAVVSTTSAISRLETAHRDLVLGFQQIRLGACWFDHDGVPACCKRNVEGTPAWLAKCIERIRAADRRD